MLQQVKQKDRSHWLGKSADNKWFENCIVMNGTFDPRLIGELWVRDLLKGKLESPEGRYYIEDGSHRALVYALNLEFNNVVKYIPVKIRLCKSWRHILPWATRTIAVSSIFRINKLLSGNNRQTHAHVCHCCTCARGR